jgi:methylmalonyl-CoA mutase cobalamin-binding subunit
MKTVVAGALGECVHVAGVANFLSLAEAAGWRTVFLGPAVSISDMLDAARSEGADLVGVSYRLTPENGERLLGEFAEAAADLHASGVRFVFGGTPPVAERARALGFFERVFDGSEPLDSIIAFMRGSKGDRLHTIDYPQTVVERIKWKKPYPLLRHHFGLPTMEATLAGVTEIAEAQVLDVISLGIDQDAQENFYHPERQDPRRRGAGGVPVRSAEDYQAIYTASRTGNFPLLRTYSGTDDFIRLAEMYVDTIHNAWCAIPLFWFNQMDGRGPWDLAESIREHQRVMAWYGLKGIPVELNEPHHWGMRDAPDVVYVVAAYLAAYNARAFGVKDYIAQLMFNSPPGLSDAMDLAKMLAIIEMISPLGCLQKKGAASTSDFRIWLQTRTGLLSYPLDPEEARAHLATSIYLQMALHPDIIHIVGHTEAHHAATAEDVIVASKLARRAIGNALHGGSAGGIPNMVFDPNIMRRKNELIAEAAQTLDAIRYLAPASSRDPLTDVETLAQAVARGVLDAPQLKNNPFARGEIRTSIIDGACQVINANGEVLSETQRMKKLL